MDAKKRKLDTSRDESHYRRPNHFDILLSMWNQGEFCDVTIQVGDKIYPVHKVILIAFIPYFRNMFSHDFTEKNKGTISMSCVNPQSMKTIIQFAYTGLISWEDVHDLPSLIKDADFLGLEDVKKEAIEILKRNSDYNDAIEMYHLSTMVFSSSLKEWSQKTIHKNFETISKTDEFLQLNFNSIKDILSVEYSKLHTNQFLKGVLRWIEHAIADRYSNLKELCSLIQIGNADFHDVLGIVNDANSKWCKLRQSTSFKSEIELSYQKSKESIESGINVKNYVSGIITCSEKSAEKFMLYNPALEKWEEIKGSGDARYDFRIAVSNFNLFMIGGIKISKEKRAYRRITTEQNESLNLKNTLNRWKQISSMGTARRLFGIVSVGKYIFVCGGVNKDGALNSVEKYTVETDTWTYVSPMEFERHSFGVAALDKYLYAIGGVNKCNKAIKEIERYDMTTNSWETLSSKLNTARRDFGVAVLNKKIYVCGGVTLNEKYEGEHLDSVEVYDPSTNEWTYVAKMPEPRYSLFVASHAGKLWAIGGMKRLFPKCKLSSVVEYNPETDNWSNVQMKKEVGMEAIKGYIVGCTV